MAKEVNQPNMVKYIGRFTAKEKAILCRLLNEYRGNTVLHQGLLPFVPVEEVINALKMGNHYNYKRQSRQMLSKLTEELEDDRGTVQFNLKLDPRKVLQKCGPHPERGKTLPWLPKEKVTVGVKWSLPKKKWVNDEDVLVAPCFSLTRIFQGARCDQFTVSVSAKCQYVVKQWLLDNCK